MNTLGHIQPDSRLPHVASLERVGVPVDHESILPSYDTKWDYVLDEVTKFTEDHRGNELLEDQAHATVSFAAGLRQYLDSNASGSMEVRAAEVLPRLLVDVISWQAEREIYVNRYRPVKVPDRVAVKTPQQRFLAARQQLVTDLADYDRLFGDHPAAYQNLLDDFHRARLMVRGSGTMLSEDQTIDRTLSAKEAAIYVIVAGYPGKVRLATPSEDKDGFQAAVRLGKTSRETVQLQILSRLRSAPLEIYPGISKGLQLIVPIYPETINPFRLSEEGIGRLKQAVADCYRREREFDANQLEEPWLEAA